jgi:antirestriction factor ArdC-like protein
MLLAGKSKAQSKAQSTQELVQRSIDSLIEALEAGHSEVLSSYLRAMGKFHTYSFGNILLIATQKPTATHVAGIRTWNELGRRVKRGERGISIYAPLIGSKHKRVSESEHNADEAAKSPNAAEQLLGFRAVYVFDVAQTEGEPLPAMGNTVKGEVGDKLQRLIEFVGTRQIKLEFSDRIFPARGISYGGLIRLLPDMEPTEKLSVLIHELAHEMLHQAERRTLISKTVRETEAEAVAFVVCDALGLEAGSGSSDYIQLYHGDAKLLRESLEVVQRAVSIILGVLSPRDAQDEKAVQ